MKILKKSLAIFLTLALCLSAMLGCLSVSAEGTALTLVLDKDTYVPGETVRIAVTAADFADIKGAEFQINLGALTDVAVENGAITIVPDNEEVEPNVWVNGSTVKFVDTFEVASGVLFTVVATAPAVGSYEVTVTDAKFGVSATDLADITVAPVTVVVEEAVVECPHEKTTTNEEVTTPATCTTAGSKTVTVTCDACGETVSTTTEEIPATGHTEGTLVSATPAVGDASHNHAEDGKVTFTCATCGVNFDQKVTYYRFYACATTNMVFESEILYQFNARDVHLDGAGAYEKGFIKIIKPYAGYDESEYNYIYSTIDEADKTTKGGYDCRTWTVGIPAKELTDTLTANVFVKRADGNWYSGQQTNKSTKDMAMNLINNANTKETEKKLLANMLVFGSKMQVFKKYGTDKLADADLTGALASLATTTTPTVADTSSNPYDTTKNQVIVNSFALDMGSKVSILYKFRTDFFKEGDLTGLKAVLTYGDSEPVAYVADEDATDKYTLISGYTDRYQFYYDKLAAKHMRTTVTLRMYNGSDVEVGYTNLMSIESLVARLCAKDSTSDEEKAALYAMINYGDAAATHFGV